MCKVFVVLQGKRDFVGLVPSSIGLAGACVRKRQVFGTTGVAFGDDVVYRMMYR